MKPVNTKLRSINTKFWDDNYIIDLTPIEKLLFLYLFSNSLVCLAGCYEITIKKISFDTGIDTKTVGTTLQRFENDKKIVYKNGFIIIKNYLKNQSLNDNMQKNVINTIEQLPVNIKNIYFKIVKPLKGFESLWKVEDEIEAEIEREREGEREEEFEERRKQKTVSKEKTQSFKTTKLNLIEDVYNKKFDSESYAKRNAINS
jgi:hypothetical protein